MNPTQPQESPYKVSSTTQSEDTEATQVSGSKGTITVKKLKFQPHWQKKYSWINYNSVTNGMLCQYCSHIYKEDKEVLKHTEGTWISFPVSNWKMALDKMKAHEASAWHKMAKAKVEAEKQSQAEGSVILQLKQGNERCDEQTKQQNRILIKKLLRIMYFLCKQKIVHFSNFDEVVQLMVENGNDEVRKHLDTAPRNANYGSYVAISEYLDAISLWVQQGILRSLKEAAFYSILADESTDIATIEELSICFRWVDCSGSSVEHFLGLISLSACDAASIFAALKSFLADSDIDAGKLRGQG